MRLWPWGCNRVGNRVINKETCSCGAGRFTLQAKCHLPAIGLFTTHVFAGSKVLIREHIIDSSPVGEVLLPLTGRESRHPARLKCIMEETGVRISDKNPCSDEFVHRAGRLCFSTAGRA